MDKQFIGQALQENLAKIMALRPDGHPSADDFQFALQVWAEAFLGYGVSWDRNLDGDRVRDGFASLRRDVLKWPMPREALDRILAIPRNQKQLPQETFEEATPAQQEACKKMLRDLLARI